VIDNDVSQTAKNIVEKIDFPIRYYIEFEKGLASVRNKAVEVSHGEFILFIDDDEEAESDWLQNMVNTQLKYNADAVFGKVVYVIPNHFPIHVRQSNYFKRKNIVTGQKLNYNEGYSGNTLVRKALCFLRSPCFKIDFNESGGEDTDFFNFLISQNCKLVYCNEAVIYETQDERRLYGSWYFNRGLNAGLNFTNNFILPMSIYKKYLNVIASFIYLLLSILLFLIYPSRYKISLYYRAGILMGKLKGIARPN